MSQSVELLVEEMKKIVYECDVCGEKSLFKNIHSEGSTGIVGNCSKCGGWHILCNDYLCKPNKSYTPVNNYEPREKDEYQLEREEIAAYTEDYLESYFNDFEEEYEDD